MSTDTARVTVGESSYEDIEFDVPGFPGGFMVIPFLSTMGATLARYGSVSLNVVARSDASCTVRVYNASTSGTVSPTVRIVCISNDYFA